MSLGACDRRCTQQNPPINIDWHWFTDDLRLDFGMIEKRTHTSLVSCQPALGSVAWSLLTPRTMAQKPKSFSFPESDETVHQTSKTHQPTNQHPVDLVPNVRGQHQDSFDIVSHDHRIMLWQQWLTKNMKQDNTYGAAQGNGTVNDPKYSGETLQMHFGLQNPELLRIVSFFFFWA